MELKFQYNKTALQELLRQLIIREKALPILKNKETALRQEVKKGMKELRDLKGQTESALRAQQSFQHLWAEFPQVLNIEELEIVRKNVVGVKVPAIEELKFSVKEVSWFSQPPWVASGVGILQRILKLRISTRIVEKQVEILYQARKKTTQKVNLYEKVQIPLFEDALMKIKRFLEDKENISKAAQKIVKKRNELKEKAA